jgi:hypothetical protein
MQARAIIAPDFNKKLSFFNSPFPLSLAGIMGLKPNNGLEQVRFGQKCG